MDFNKYRQTAQEIENNFIENGRSYEDALNKIVIDLFDEMEEDYKQEQSEQLLIHGVVDSKINVLVTYENYYPYPHSSFGEWKKETKVLKVDKIEELNNKYDKLIDVKVLN